MTIKINSCEIKVHKDKCRNACMDKIKHSKVPKIMQMQRKIKY